MSIPVLEQVYDEVRRLSIAGSVVAPGDFRLKKLAPALEQAGKKAPVFAKVAQGVTGVVESTEKTSAQALLDLSTLVNAILYTQGETGLPGEIEPIETVDLGQRQAQVSAQVLKPLLEALSTTGSGRMKVVQEAYERGAFSDLRLIPPALDAIDDPNTEIAEFIADKVLPIYGKAILGELRAKFDPKGRGGQVRRLGSMHHFDPEGSREIVQRAVDEGSQEVRIAAIGCLGGAAGDMPVLLEMRKSRAEKVRVAAYEAIGKSDDERAVAALCDAVKGNDLVHVFVPIQSNRNPIVLQCALKEAKATLDSLLAGKEKDKAKRDLQVERMRCLLLCFNHRTDKEIESFLLDAFADRHRIAAIKTNSPGEDLDHALLRLMSDGGPRNAQRALVDAHATLDDETIKLPNGRRRREKEEERFGVAKTRLSAKNADHRWPMELARWPDAFVPR
jgi:HEAT repeat protein